MKFRKLALCSAFLSASLFCLAAANGSWLKKIPAKDRVRVNPYAGNAEAVAAGKNLFQDNCARCHGTDAQGKNGRPSLRSERVQHATDGELAWLLKNGEIYKGMPNWSALPEQQRWQIIAYLRSLPPQTQEAK
jgi:mono/diheme cytochrome c family protein